MTLRDRLKSGHGAWPSPEAIDALLRLLAETGPDGWPGRASRTGDALAHAELLGTVAPGAVTALTALRRQLAASLDDVVARSGPVVHGDLHEGQLLVDGSGAITGLIDIDDLGPGDPVDDPATLLGHLEYRSITATDPRLSARVHDHVVDLRDHFGAIHGTGPLELVTAAVLVGLATGPFRVQATGWAPMTMAVVDTARRWADRAAATGVGGTGVGE